MSLVQKLAYLRHRDKLTAEEISARSGIPLGTLNKILTGKIKNPTLTAMDKICRVFNVPIRYLLDETVSESCCVSAYAEQAGMLLISQRELEFFHAYRRLDEHGRAIVERLMKSLVGLSPAPLDPPSERVLSCYESIAQGERGAYGDAFFHRLLCAPLDEVTRAAHFAIRLATSSLEPAYPPGAVLAVREGQVAHGRLGLFLVNREGFVRKLCARRGERKLISVNVEYKNICLSPADEVHTVGPVLGEIRSYRWLQAPNSPA